MTITLAEYQQSITRTYAISDPVELITLALIGLMGELGEVADPLKKALWQGHPLDSLHLLEEIGDLLWYLATLCNALDLSLEEAIEGNLAKLAERYPDGFSSERSLHRADEPYQKEG